MPQRIVSAAIDGAALACGEPGAIDAHVAVASR